jgi:hypothetical protein
MKRELFTAVALFAAITIGAQNIAVVSPNNETTMCQTLDDAITTAVNGSIIYLPGGGLQIKDETKIDKRVTIMGVSHRGDTDNADGATVIAGNLNFDKGSSGSSVIGVYITGDINVGTSTDSVLNLTVRYCNMRSVQVKHAQSSGMVVNQCYIRDNTSFGNANVKLTNCVTSVVQNITGGTIMYNIMLGTHNHYNSTHFAMWNINSSLISYNIFYRRLVDSYLGSTYYGVNNCTGCNNFGANWGDDRITIDAAITDLFKKWNNGAISPTSNFHFIDKYKEYEEKIGIYGGTGFSDEKSLAPIPRIISKEVNEQTDGTGKLTIKVTVKSN